jgi:hypothetical protein
MHVGLDDQRAAFLSFTLRTIEARRAETLSNLTYVVP